MGFFSKAIKKHQNVMLAFLGSVIIHATLLTIIQILGLFGDANKVEASLRYLHKPASRLNIELVKIRGLTITSPDNLSQPPRQADIVAPIKSAKSLASPKRGYIVLPDEALRSHSEPRKAEITAQFPSIPAECVVPHSRAGAPVIVTPEIFARAESLSPSFSREYGLGGTGDAVGAGPFGDNPKGSGTKEEGQDPLASPDSKVASIPKTPHQPLQPKSAMRDESQFPGGPTCGPKLLEWKDPPYPEQARQDGRQGTVVLRATIDVDGKPKHVEVAVSSGSEILDRAAQEYMKLAKFSPALKDGNPVSSIITFRVRFKLNTFNP
ncbi:MAG: energy transducer TonB [Armatimonadota bacterium]|nr:energy transducer TonB [Armatimonadota bacterium]